MGFGFMEVALLAEEVGRVIGAVPFLPHVVGGIGPLVRAGSAEQKERLLPRAIAGEILLSAALEEGTGIEDERLATTARAEGGGFRLKGRKTGVPFALQAERVLTAARTDDGVVMVLLDPRAAGVRATALKTTSFEPHALLELDDVKVDAADVLAGPAQGAALMAAIRREYLAAVCMHQLGVCDTMMRMTASYTTERKQFGVPIATFQAVGHRAANCFIDVECLRLTAYEAASLLAEGFGAAVEVDIAKIWAGDVGHRTSYAAQHLHGGAGVDRGNALWRFCLWARHNEMTLGSSAAHLASLGRRCASGEALIA